MDSSLAAAHVRAASPEVMAARVNADRLMACLVGGLQAQQACAGVFAAAAFHVESVAVSTCCLNPALSCPRLCRSGRLSRGKQ